MEQENLIADFSKLEMKQDLAHDFAHVQRVVAMAKHLCVAEQADVNIVMPAAWLHDCFAYAKDHPERHLSSRIAAQRAYDFLSSIDYPAQYLDSIHHAIVAHSFSAGIPPQTIEAKIIQDADRLDALGAIGIARCIQVSTTLERPLYQLEDPFCEQRAPNDQLFTLDHFYRKLLLLSDKMNTESAKKEAQKRTKFMRAYLAQLQREVA